MKVRVAPSKIHGKGIFATVDIKKGERVFVFPGKIVHKEIKSEKDSLRFINWVGVGKNLWLNPNGGWGRHLNHSCEPNSALHGKKTIIAIRNIKRGEEITFDYSFTDLDPYWNIKCNCLSKNCRKMVGSIHSLSMNMFKRYLGHIPLFAQKEYTHTNAPLS